MEFLTIHELSVEFDVPARVLRYRFLQLVQEAKLVEGQDYRRDDFVDEQHFVWKINPVSFMRETGYRLVNKSGSVVAKSGNKPAAVATKQDNSIEVPVTKMVNEPPPFANHQNDLDNKDGNHVGNKSGDEGKTRTAAMPSLERELIDLLKGQLGVKDGQIHELTDQNTQLNDLNIKLVGQAVQQAEKIQSLLRLTGGKSEPTESTTGNQANDPNRAGNADSRDADLDNHSVNEQDHDASMQKV